MKIHQYLKRQFVIAISTQLVIFALPLSTLAADFPRAGNFAQGAKSWAENCSRCHNVRDPRDLRDDQWITSVFHMRVRAGLTGGQARDILTFLQESNNAAAAEPATSSLMAENTVSSRSGAEVFNQTCIACHGANGKGTVPGAPDLTRPDGPLAQPDDVLLKHIVEGFQSPGSPMAMPPKGGNTSLTIDDIRAVLGYLRESFEE